MYTAKITNKKEVPQGIEVTVEFTNGTKTLTEAVVPQDKRGFDHWLESRLTSLNSIADIEAIPVNTEIDGTQPEPVDTRTQAEKDRDNWLRKYYKWVQIKNNLIDTGVLTGNEKPVTDYLADVRAGFKPAYINEL